MFYEPTTLASITSLLAVSLQEEYGIDPAPLFEQVGMSVTPVTSPQLRYPFSKICKLWELSKKATGDETIGLKTGAYAQPAHFYALGYSISASSTLLGALRRIVRYQKLVSTASWEIKITETVDSYALSAEFPDESRSPPKEGIDCGMTALLALCDYVAGKEIRPLRVELTCPETVHPDAYRQALRAPVRFGADAGVFYFDKALLQEQLSLGAPDVAKATDRISEQYIETLDPHKVASQVRQLLVALLPSGKADQDLVSKRLNRSTSTLQRQLQAEGLSYRDVLDDTRRSLAESYLTDNKHSHAQIAFLLGFSDQSNFSRAFKRWTSMSPGQYHEANSV
jgi:AraC-like DNA-binding protein